jgi:dTDP-4-dehydrorhamnose 3,5-epimerase-like enzyme
LEDVEVRILVVVVKIRQGSSSSLGYYSIPVDSTSWRVIICFEIMFHEFQEVLDTDQPTLPIFDHYFNLAIANHDYLSIKRRQGGLEIFNFSNPRISRIDASLKTAGILGD